MKLPAHHTIPNSLRDSGRSFHNRYTGKPSTIAGERCVKTTEYLTKYKDQIIFSLLLIYIIVLGFGVIGELFNIEWILNFPLFKL